MGRIYVLTFTIAYTACIVLLFLYWINTDHGENKVSKLQYNSPSNSHSINDHHLGTNNKKQEKAMDTQRQITVKTAAKSPKDIPHKVDQYGATYFNSSHLDITLYTNNSSPLIPHIIHQTWSDYNVPRVYVPWIKSIAKAHPHWQYWFWTDQDIKCYFKTRHSDFLSSFLSYPYVIYKADVMRYFILYDYGGFYMDLDIEVLKSLDIWSYISESIVSQESYEHSYIVHRHRSSPNLINAVMATKPHHAYYKMLQRNLATYWKKYPNKLLESTGPWFIDSIYKEYKKDPLHEPVTVIGPKYWFPTLDPIMIEKTRQVCGNKTAVSQQKVLQEICAKNIKENFTNKPGGDAFLNHHWVHSYLQKPSFKTSNLTSMFNVIPNLIKVSSRLKLNC